MTAGEVYVLELQDETNRLRAEAARLRAWCAALADTLGRVESEREAHARAAEFWRSHAIACLRTCGGNFGDRHAGETDEEYGARRWGDLPGDGP